MPQFYVILVAVYVAALTFRIGYDRLKQLGRVDPASRVVFAIVFADMATLWTSWFLLCERDPSELGVPMLVRRLGLGLTVIGGLLFVAALAQLKALENTQVLVTNGLFRVMRHPIYTGFACWFIGWPLNWDRGWSLLLGMLSLAAVFWWRRSEDRALVVQFGSAYRDYMRRTPF